MGKDVREHTLRISCCLQTAFPVSPNILSLVVSFFKRVDNTSSIERGVDCCRSGQGQRCCLVLDRGPASLARCCRCPRIRSPAGSESTSGETAFGAAQTEHQHAKACKNVTGALVPEPPRKCLSVRALELPVLLELLTLLQLSALCTRIRRSAALGWTSPPAPRPTVTGPPPL